MIHTSWRKVSLIPSTNNENYVWRQLDYFSSPANVCRFLKKRHPSLDAEISEIKGIEISSCITQAEQYYDSAKAVDYATKPLLLFYCLENLMSALLMVLRPNLTLKSFKESHGTRIMKHQPEEYQTDLSKIFIQIQKSGLFVELFRMNLFDWMQPRHISPDVSKFAAGFRFDNEKTDFLSHSVSLRDLLALIPEIGEVYMRIFGSYPYIFCGGLTYHWKGNEVEKIDLFIDRKTEQITEKLLLEKLPMLSEGYKKEEKDKYFKFTCPPSTQPPLLCDDIYGHSHIKGGVPNYLCKNSKIELCDDRLLLLDLEAHFLIMYALSMLCRYKLRLWHNLMVKKEQGLDHLIKRFLEISSYKFPFLIWREMFNVHFLLMPPGTLYKPYR